MTAFSVPRYAVITTHNRLEHLDALVGALYPQVDYITIVDNASDPPVSPTRYDLYTNVIRDDEQPPNLYRLWNLGLEVVREHAEALGEWDVAIFNDDVTLDGNWFTNVATALRSGPYAVASTSAHGTISQPRVMTQPGGGIWERMCPWAFVTRGELGLRADEDYRWWFGDTHFEWVARQSGGVIIVPGPIPGNTCANSTTVGALAEQAGRDGETFARKWGSRPW